jgi:gamma-glutamyltranspeptidase
VAAAFRAICTEGGLAARLLDPTNLRNARARVSRRLRSAHGTELASVGGTTHVSAIDAEGNAASVSTSTGSGSGVIVPGTGIYMNNMLGEYDLVAGRTIPAGRRLTSMMAPSIALDGAGRPRLVVGSAGSARLRGAIMQIVVNVLEHGNGVADAISAPRVHLDGTHLHCEGGHADAELERLERLGYDVVRWRRRNLFFGGAAAVEICTDGTLAAAGDPRREAPGSSSSDRPHPRSRAGRRGGARGARECRRLGARGLAAGRLALAQRRRGAPLHPRAAAAPPTAR